MFSLTASRDRERSFESKDWGGGHGIFTYYVVKGLEGEADESGDGIVTADELAELRRAAMCAKPPRGSRIPRPTAAASIPTCCWRFMPNGLRVGARSRRRWTAR